MDINHFFYFAAIVEANLNLSAAAKKIHISQSALSKIITSFEQEEGVLLFNRQNGRLISLTPAGSAFYSAGLKIIDIYDELMTTIMKESGKAKGKVVIGIPPLVVTLIFAQWISDFLVQFPNIELEIIEAGAEELREKFLAHEIDFVALLSPTQITGAEFREYPVYFDELAAFVSKDSNLAGKDQLNWSDLNHRKMAIFNESFTIHRLLTEKFKQTDTQPIISIKSASWDFLLEAAQNHDIITVLPKPITQYVDNNKNFVRIPFRDPIIWKVVLTEHISRKQTAAQNFFRQYLLNQCSVR